MTDSRHFPAAHTHTVSRSRYMACAVKYINERWAVYDAVRHSYAVEDYTRRQLCFDLGVEIPWVADGSVHLMPSKGALMNHFKKVLQRMEKDPDYEVTE